MLRIVDIFLAIIGLIASLPLLLILVILGFLDTGSPLFFQTRIGYHKKKFTLIKFRTMHPSTQSVATHFVDTSAITRLGCILRRSKLDELPQLWNVLKGEMSLVGPRPCLPSQLELIEERERRGIFSFRPGITGLAQINGIDMSTPRLLAEVDERMLKDLTLFSYFGLILKTIVGSGSGDKVQGGRS